LTRYILPLLTSGNILSHKEWYARRGYRLIKTVQNYYHVGDKNGKVWDTKTVFMRKEFLISIRAIQNVVSIVNKFIYIKQ
jgi:hypothetical protein